MNAIILAAEQDDVNEMRRLLRNPGAKLNAVSEGRTALMLAADKGHARIVGLLCDAGANLEPRNKYGWTALMMAAYKGNIRIIKLLCDAGANIKARNKHGWTVLMIAASYGYEDVVNLLCSKPLVLEGINDINLRGNTALMLAVEKGYIAVVKILLEMGANFYTRNNNNSTALMLAAQNGYLLTVQLMAAQHDLDKEEALEAAIDIAVRYKRSTIAKLLRNIKAVNTDLLIAAAKGELLGIEKALLAGAHINARSSERRSTALTIAAKKGHLNVIESLIEENAEVNVRSENDWTPLLLAAEGGYTKIVELLHAAGADLEQVNRNSYTALQLAIQQNRVETVEKLIQLGANFNVEDNQGYNIAIVLALRVNNIKIKKILIDAYMLLNGKKNINTLLYMELIQFPFFSYDAINIIIEYAYILSVRENSNETVPALVTRIQHLENENAAYAEKIASLEMQLQSLRIQEEGDGAKTVVMPKKAPVVGNFQYHLKNRKREMDLSNDREPYKNSNTRKRSASFP